jgi:F-type H+-transporting ATPase subunit a
MNFSEISPKVAELIGGLKSFELLSAGPYFSLTSYSMFMLVAMALLLGFFAIARKNEGLVPKGRVANLAETLVEFVRDDICAEIIGHGSQKYFPFLATVFCFVLFNNLLGLIPGFKPGSGSIGITLVLGLIVFVFFNTMGIREQGFFKYFKNLVPHGVPFPINIVVWAIEFLSMLLRPFTLAIRLFANMYAGHIVLGVFAVLVELSVEPLIHAIQTGGAIGGPALGSLSGIVWLALLIALYTLEVLVAFIQAYVFTLLSTIYISSAVHEH